MSVKKFFQKAFSDMKESAKAQHEVDKVKKRHAQAQARIDNAKSNG